MSIAKLSFVVLALGVFSAPSFAQVGQAQKFAPLTVTESTQVMFEVSQLVSSASADEATSVAAAKKFLAAASQMDGMEKRLLSRKQDNSNPNEHGVITKTEYHISGSHLNFDEVSSAGQLDVVQTTSCYGDMGCATRLAVTYVPAVNN